MNIVIILLSIVVGIIAAGIVKMLDKDMGTSLTTLKNILEK